MNFDATIACLKITSYLLDFFKNIFLLIYISNAYPIQIAFAVILVLPILTHLLLMVTGADPLGMLRMIFFVIQSYIYILLCGFSHDAINLYVCICVFNVLLLVIDISYRSYTNKVFEYLISACTIYTRSLWPVFIYNLLFFGFIFASSNSPFAIIEYRLLLCTYFWIGEYCTHVYVELLCAADLDEMEPNKLEINADWITTTVGRIYTYPIYLMGLFIFIYVILSLVLSWNWFNDTADAPIGDRIICVYFLVFGGIFALCTGCPLAYYTITKTFTCLWNSIKSCCCGDKKPKASKKKGGTKTESITESPMAAKV